MQSLNIESLHLEESVININVATPLKQENMRAWSYELLFACDLFVLDYDLGADLHQISFRYADQLFILSLSDLADSIWIDSAGSNSNAVQALYEYLKSKLIEN